MTESASFLGTTNHTEATDNAAKARVQKNNGYLVGVEDELEVIQNTPAAMNVIVGKGEAWVQGVQYTNGAAKTVTVDAADATNPRIDRIVLRLTWAADTLEAVYLKGTAAASPSAPALTQTAAVWELSLAYLTIPVGKTSILTADITDERDTSACGQAACNLGDMHIEADGTLDAASHKIQNLADPTSNQDADTKAARDAAITAAIAAAVPSGIGGNWKVPVVAASTAAVTLADMYNGQSLDGVTLVTGDRILLLYQADGTGGAYVVKASGAPDRATDCDTASEVLGSSYMVTGGTVNGGTAWHCVNTSITLGTTVLVFAKYLLDKSSIASTTGTVQCGSLGAKSTDSAAIMFRRSGVYKVRIYTPSGDSDQSAKTAQIKYGSSTLNLYGGSSGGSFGAAEEITITAPTYLSLANNDLTSTWMVLQITNADGWM